jgi:hypothetical protein
MNNFFGDDSQVGLVAEESTLEGATEPTAAMREMATRSGSMQEQMGQTRDAMQAGVTEQAGSGVAAEAARLFGRVFDGGNVASAADFTLGGVGGSAIQSQISDVIGSFDWGEGLEGFSPWSGSSIGGKLKKTAKKASKKLRQFFSW